MGYDLHIERPAKADDEPEPIPFEEWKAAVSATAGVRLFQAERHIGKIPGRGQFSVGARDGDAEVFFPDEKRWHWVFRWFEGRASFPVPHDHKLRLELGGPVWTVAVALATKLNAVIRGDESEVYDLRTGQATMS